MLLSRKRISSLLICIILAFLMVVPAGARASAYFSRTYVQSTDIGNGVIRIKIDLAGTGTMQEIGATQVIVYEEQSNGNYEAIRTYTREEYPSLISYNRVSHVSYITHYGTPGKSYFALCAFYAKNSTGSQIKWGTSNAT